MNNYSQAGNLRKDCQYASAGNTLKFLQVSRMQGKRTFFWHRIVLLLLIVAVLSQQGCVHRKRYSLASFWIDYNTLRAPAIFFQKREHFPYKASQVSLFHWQYGVTPGRNVKYVRPDLVRENTPPALPYDGVMQTGGVMMEPTPEIDAAPAVNANSAMSLPLTNVGPQTKSKKKLPAPPQIPLQETQPPATSLPPPPAPPTSD